MIEQTKMTVSAWLFHPLCDGFVFKNLTNTTTIEVMRKRAATKKGIACRLTCCFTNGDDPVLDYVAEHSYVIDLYEVIDKKELMKMIHNSFSEFNEKFEFRKLGTILQNEKLTPIDVINFDLDPIILLLA